MSPPPTIPRPRRPAGGQGSSPAAVPLRPDSPSSRHESRPQRRPRPSHRRERLSQRTRTRLFALLGVFAIAFAAITARLVWVQGVGRSRYQAFGAGEDVRSVVLPAVRGGIFDRNGRELAFSRLRSTVFADPHQIRHPGAEAHSLAPLLGTTVAALTAKLSLRAGYVPLAQGLSRAKATAVANLYLPGIAIGQAPQRYYPAGQLAQPLLGGVNGAGKGASGLELLYNSLMQGTPGRLVEQVDPQGQAVPGGTIKDQPALRGSDVMLTVDEALQYQTEQALAQGIVASKSKRGMALVMDTHTGALLAVADLSAGKAGQHRPQAVPVSFASNGNQEPAGTPGLPPQPVESAQASAFTRVYEPGSVEKLVTVSGALQQGAIVPGQSFTIPDHYFVAGHMFHDAETHPTERLSVTGILAQSSNIGATKIAQRLGAVELMHYIKDYGLTVPTGIGFPGEASGLIPALSQWSGTTLPTVSFGQGIAVTAVQMIAAYNAIANGGLYVPPRLVKATIGLHGHEHPLPAPAAHRVVAEKVASEMIPMFEQVVAAGTGTNAQVPPYAVAGKTGTAYVSDPSGGYNRAWFNSSFAGFAPAQHPAVTVMVVMEHTKDYGAQASAPTFSVITRAALEDLKVPPQGTQPPPAATASPTPLSGG